MQDHAAAHEQAAQDSADEQHWNYDFLFSKEEIRRHIEEFFKRFHGTLIPSGTELDEFAATLVKEPFTRAASREEAEEKRTAAFSPTLHYLNMARDVLSVAMLQRSNNILAQVCLMNHIKTVEALLSQKPKAEQFTVSVNVIENNARLLAEACVSSSWAEVEHYMNVFKTTFGI